MKASELDTFVGDLCSAYNRTKPKDEVMDFLLAKVGNIPATALDWMTERFLDRNSMFPNRLHRAILDCWQEWRNAHPERCERKMDCRNQTCSSGWLRLAKWDKDTERRRIVNVTCKDCRRLPHWKSGYSLHEAELAGMQECTVELQREIIDEQYERNFEHTKRLLGHQRGFLRKLNGEVIAPLPEVMEEMVINLTRLPDRSEAVEECPF